MELRDFFEMEEEWEPVSRVSLVAWLVFYALFFLHALTDADGFLLIDNVNLIVHEAGHMLFSGLGPTATLYGGTLLQFLVPLALACYFWLQRKTSAVAFTIFCTFENCLYTGIYMADARAQALPLVVSGDPEPGTEHDWFMILSRWDLLQQDVALGDAVRALGWLGMAAAVGWLVYRYRQKIA